MANSHDSTEPVAWIEHHQGSIAYNPYPSAARQLPDGVRFDLYTAAPVAQQPQEIEVQCPVCNHKFYEWPNDKQPQAEAVPQAAEFYWLVEHFDIANKSTGHYYTGKVGIADRALTTMDPHQAKRYDTWRAANIASAQLGSTLTGTWRAMQHGFHRMEPQQAEAVPLFAALKVEGPRFHCAKVYGRIYQVLAVGSNKEDLLTVARLAKDAYYKQFPGTHEYKEPPFEWVVEEVPTAQPKFQPTEAVPSDVVRDAERYRFIRDNCNRRINIEIDNAGLEISDTVDAAIDAAIAQQKGGV